MELQEEKKKVKVTSKLFGAKVSWPIISKPNSGQTSENKNKNTG